MPRRRSHAAALALVLAAFAVACDTDDGRTLDPPRFGLPATTIPATSVPVESIETVPAPMQMFAPWPDGAPIPDRHTCVGEGISPALSWIDVPIGTLELAITLTNFDTGMSTHWIVDGIATSTAQFGDGLIPPEAFERTNSSGETGYEPPCPPEGESHLVQFTLHALNQQLEVADDATADEILSFLNQTALDQSSVSGIVTGSS